MKNPHHLSWYGSAPYSVRSWELLRSNSWTSLRRNRRCPPRVRMQFSLPDFAHRVTVLGSTLNIRATSAGVRSSEIPSCCRAISSPPYRDGLSGARTESTQIRVPSTVPHRVLVGKQKRNSRENSAFSALSVLGTTSYPYRRAYHQELRLPVPVHRRQAHPSS